MPILKPLLFVALLCNIGAASAAELTIYVSPNGNDNTRGTSKTEAVATIGRAIQLAESASADTNQANIVLAPGTYPAQSFLTHGNPNAVPILINSGNGGRAVFDGAGQGGTWMTLKPRAGKPANIHIQGLEVINYETAIDVRGNRNNPVMWAGGLTIRDNRFAKIGDIARADAQPSTAAIRLVNSDRNVIEDNQFIHIRNNKLCGLLHAIYIAHGSTENLIAGNTFEDSCGDAVRFRDGSGDNIVRGNKFIDAWSRSPVSDWFCNSAQRSNCTKKQGECPSYNNLIENNEVTARNLQPPMVFIPYGGKPPVKCQPGIPPKRAIVR